MEILKGWLNIMMNVRQVINGMKNVDSVLKDEDKIYRNVFIGSYIGDTLNVISVESTAGIDLDYKVLRIEDDPGMYNKCDSYIIIKRTDYMDMINRLNERINSREDT